MGMGIRVRSAKRYIGGFMFCVSGMVCGVQLWPRISNLTDYLAREGCFTMSPVAYGRVSNARDAQLSLFVK